MGNFTQEEVYKTIDDYLKKHRSGGYTYTLIGNPIGKEALKIMKHYSLIEQRGDIVDVTLEGVRVIEASGIKRYLEIKQKVIDEKKARDDAKFEIDLQNAKR